jgi:hypothetical protein
LRRGFPGSGGSDPGCAVTVSFNDDIFTFSAKGEGRYPVQQVEAGGQQ